MSIHNNDEVFAFGFNWIINEKKSTTLFRSNWPWPQWRGIQLNNQWKEEYNILSCLLLGCVWTIQLNNQWKEEYNLPFRRRILGAVMWFNGKINEKKSTTHCITNSLKGISSGRFNGKINEKKSTTQCLDGKPIRQRCRFNWIIDEKKSTTEQALPCSEAIEGGFNWVINEKKSTTCPTVHNSNWIDIRFNGKIDEKKSTTYALLRLWIVCVVLDSMEKSMKRRVQHNSGSRKNPM